jgi:hypothetical protein
MIVNTIDIALLSFSCTPLNALHVVEHHEVALCSVFELQVDPIKRMVKGIKSADYDYDHTDDPPKKALGSAHGVTGGHSTSVSPEVEQLGLWWHHMAWNRITLLCSRFSAEPL